MNLEEISAKVRDHLTVQKARSVSENGQCRYRGTNGTMCAVGCLVTDEVYDSINDIIEGCCADASSVVAALRDSLGWTPKKETIRALILWQQYHDDHLEVTVPEYMRTNEAPSYAKWIETGDEAHSPAAAYKAITEGKYK